MPAFTRGWADELERGVDRQAAPHQRLAIALYAVAARRRVGWAAHKGDPLMTKRKQVRGRRGTPASSPAAVPVSWAAIIVIISIVVRFSFGHLCESNQVYYDTTYAVAFQREVLRAVSPPKSFVFPPAAGAGPRQPAGKGISWGGAGYPL